MRIIRRNPAGRPRSWSDESLIATALEWRRRHGRLPRASDWSTVKARNSGGTAQQRLDDPPPGCDRWPAASTVNDAFGSWRAFREACESDLPSPPAQTVRARAYRGWPGYRLWIEVFGDTDIVERASEQWQAVEAGPVADERGFVVWVVMSGHALVDDPDGRLSADAETLEQQLLDAMVAGDLWLAFDPASSPVGDTVAEEAAAHRAQQAS